MLRGLHPVHGCCLRYARAKCGHTHLASHYLCPIAEVVAPGLDNNVIHDLLAMPVVVPHGLGNAHFHLIIRHIFESGDRTSHAATCNGSDDDWVRISAPKRHCFPSLVDTRYLSHFAKRPDSSALAEYYPPNKAPAYGSVKGAVKIVRVGVY